MTDMQRIDSQVPPSFPHSLTLSLFLCTYRRPSTGARLKEEDREMLDMLAPRGTDLID